MSESIWSKMTVTLCLDCEERATDRAVQVSSVLVPGACSDCGVSSVDLSQWARTRGRRRLPAAAIKAGKRTPARGQ